MFVHVYIYAYVRSWAGIINTLRPRQNGRHFPDDIFKWIFFNENVWISINFSLKYVSRGPINNVPTLVQVMAWRRPGDKPLSEPMMVRLPTHICVTRPQWVKYITCSNWSMSYSWMWACTDQFHSILLCPILVFFNLITISDIFRFVAARVKQLKLIDK